MNGHDIVDALRAATDAKIVGNSGLRSVVAVLNTVTGPAVPRTTHLTIRAEKVTVFFQAHKKRLFRKSHWVTIADSSRIYVEFEMESIRLGMTHRSVTIVMRSWERTGLRKKDFVQTKFQPTDMRRRKLWDFVRNAFLAECKARTQKQE